MASDEEACSKIVGLIENDVLDRKSRNLILIAELLGVSVESLFASAREKPGVNPDASEIAEMLKCFTCIKDPVIRQKVLDAAKRLAINELD